MSSVFKMNLLFANIITKIFDDDVMHKPIGLCSHLFASSQAEFLITWAGLMSDPFDGYKALKSG